MEAAQQPMATRRLHPACRYREYHALKGSLTDASCNGGAFLCTQIGSYSWLELVSSQSHSAPRRRPWPIRWVLGCSALSGGGPWPLRARIGALVQLSACANSPLSTPGFYDDWKTFYLTQEVKRYLSMAHTLC